MKRALVRILGVPLGFLAAQAWRLSGAHQGLAMMYHRVGDPQGDPDRELVPSLGTRRFARQIRYLGACFRSVPASELGAAVAARRRGQRIPVAITFDDDLACHAGEAAPLLRRAGLPATFFLSGASLSRPYAFWWERLQAAVDRDWAEACAVVGVSEAPKDIHELAMAVQEMEPPDRDAAATRLREALGPDADDAGMRAAAVRELVEAGFEVGFHTRRHDFLPALDDGGLAAAMTDGRSQLEELASRPLETIAYPHGGVDTRVAEAARAAGFRYGFTTQPEAVGTETDPLLMGRVEAPFDSVSRLAFTLARALWVGRSSAGGRRRRDSRGTGRRAPPGDGG
jgi:peptidoglycan/xylan/chitin deacetylase (PgdA/CDA1 family)